MIEPIDPITIDELLPLIRDYFKFYAIDGITDESMRNFFSQFGPSSDQGCLFAYRQKGGFVGFATVYFSYASSVLGKVAVLNDLYTEERHRKQGVATALINCCVDYAKQHNAKRLQWATAASNQTAQSVYDSFGAKSSNWLFYTYAIES